jgi:peptidyl-prolyl cis-trans isomerase SurA
MIQTLKILTFFVFFSVLVSHASGSEVIESVVAVVNSSIITKSDVTKYRDNLRSGTIADDLLGSNKEELLKDNGALLKAMIDEHIIDDEVKRQNLNVTIERVEQEINSIQGRNSLTRDQLKEALKREGTNFSDYQDFIKKRLERQSVIEKAITSKIKISDEDVANLYESKNKSGSANSFEYVIAHILFRAGKRPDDEQKNRCEDVLAKLKKGGTFEALASQYSEDPGFNEGGYLGKFRAGETLKPIEDSVKTLTPGEYAGCVKTKLGYHIIKLLERHVVPDSKFEKDKEPLRQELYQHAFVKQFQFWLDQKRQESFVRIN